jgi:hypothetical protein
MPFLRFRIFVLQHLGQVAMLSSQKSGENLRPNPHDSPLRSVLYTRADSYFYLRGERK